MKKEKLDRRKLQTFKKEESKCTSMDWTAQSVCKYEVFVYVVDAIVVGVNT